MDRIFGLDIQLGFDVLCQAVAVFIMFAFLSYVLFEPVRKLLNDRKNKIADDLDTAAADKKEAARLKAEYEEKIRDIEKEADEILSQARKKALKREDEIISEARQEALKRAENEIALEKKKVRDQVKQEMIQVAVAMAGKIITDKIDPAKQDALVEETLKEMGDQTWRS